MAQTATAEAPHSLPRRVAGWVKVGLAVLVFGLIIAGQIIFLVRSAGGRPPLSGSGPQATAHHGSFASRLNAALAASLGPSDRNARRFAVTSVRADGARPGLKTIAIRWAINNDLSQGTVGNGARQDVYAMLQAIFGSRLPVSWVRLDGTYPLRDGRETPVMRLSMDQRTAGLITRVGWDTMDPESVWPLVHRDYVNPQFEPLSSDG